MCIPIVYVDGIATEKDAYKWVILFLFIHVNVNMSYTYYMYIPVLVCTSALGVYSQSHEMQNHELLSCVSIAKIIRQH